MNGRFYLHAFLMLFICYAPLFSSPIPAVNKLSKRLRAKLAVKDDDTRRKVWVYFTDKDETPAAYLKAASTMTARAAVRRRDIPLDWYDLPVKDEYIDNVRKIGGQDVRASRWLNAVSVRLTESRIRQLAGESFIKMIDIVATLTRHPAPEPKQLEFIPLFDSTEYGPSYTQNHMLGIDSLHKVMIPAENDSVPLNGAGVLIAFLDTGYEIDHQVFDSIRTKIIDTWDFINDDADIDDSLPVSSQLDHGTATLSACGGYFPGELIGPAYGADYVLYKTENTQSETQIEEDYWVFASERADSVGADIISSSLGYIDWYQYSDMDGNTAVTTIAADIAASRGILVVTSAGNEAGTAWNYIIAPADGDSVVAVGAVTSSGTIAGFSSYGPSYDGRVKPEVVAMGVNVRCAADGGGYTYKSGTSLSCPLIAGSAALILQANPSLRGQPYKIRQRLIESSDRYPVPDPGNRCGYGLPDIIAAAGWTLEILPIPPVTVTVGRDTVVVISTLAPLAEIVIFEQPDFPANFSLADPGDGTAELTITGDISQLGSRQYHLAAYVNDLADTLEFTVITGTGEAPLYVGPNPFSDALNFNLTRAFPGGYVIEIFTLAGELVFTRSGSQNPFTWHGINDRGEKVASGVYIIRFSADGIEERVKVFKL